MRPATPELDALLMSGRFEHANCFEFLLRDGMGTAIRLTDADHDITVYGETYRSADIKGLRLRVVRGLEVDEQTIEWTPSSTSTLRLRPIRTMIRKGFFNRATVISRRMFFPDWSAPATGWIITFVGQVADIDLLGGVITIKVNSLLVLLNVNIPAPVYQAACRHVFGSPSCGVNLPALEIHSVARPGSTASSILCDLQYANHTWDHGLLTMTSGDCQGMVRTVKTSTAGRIDLVGPLPFVPAAGDTFKVTPGCDKTLSSGTADGDFGCWRYRNIARYGGFPWVPVPETGT